MTHEEAKDLLLDLAYGELAPEDARAVELHAAGCAECGEERRRIAHVRALASRAAEPTSTRGTDAILAAARRAAAERRPRLRAPSRRVSWAIATAAVLAIVVGVTLRVSESRAKRSVDVEEVVAKGDPGPPAPASAPAAPAPAADALAAPPRASIPAPPAAPRERAEVAGDARRAQKSSPAPRPSAPRARESAPAAGGADARGESGASFSAMPAPAAPAPPREESPPAAPSEPGASRGAAAEAPSPAFQSAAGEARGKRAAPPAALMRRRDSAGEVATAGLVARAQEDVERRRAAGELVERARRVSCGGALQDRRALVDGDGRVVKLTFRDADGTVREGWYDGAGALRAARASRGGADAGDPRMPPREPAAALDAPCP
jgi:hypothetical protein